MQKVRLLIVVALAMWVVIASLAHTSAAAGKFAFQIGMASVPVGGYSYGMDATWWKTIGKNQYAVEHEVNYSQEVMGGNGLYLAVDYKIVPWLRIGAGYSRQHNPLLSPVNATGGMTTASITGNIKWAVGSSVHSERRLVLGVSLHNKEYKVDSTILDEERRPKPQTLSVSYHPSVGYYVGYEVEGDFAKGVPVRWFSSIGIMMADFQAYTVLLDGVPTNQYSYLKSHRGRSMIMTGGITF